METHQTSKRINGKDWWCSGERQEGSAVISAKAEMGFGYNYLMTIVLV